VKRLGFRFPFLDRNPKSSFPLPIRSTFPSGHSPPFSLLSLAKKSGHSLASPPPLASNSSPLHSFPAVSRFSPSFPLGLMDSSSDPSLYSVSTIFSRSADFTSLLLGHISLLLCCDLNPQSLSLTLSFHCPFLPLLPLPCFLRRSAWSSSPPLFDIPPPLSIQRPAVLF